MHGIPVKVYLLSLFSGQYARYAGNEEVGAGFRGAAAGCYGICSAGRLAHPWGGDFQNIAAFGT